MQQPAVVGLRIILAARSRFELEETLAGDLTETVHNASVRFSKQSPNNVNIYISFTVVEFVHIMSCHKLLTTIKRKCP